MRARKKAKAEREFVFFHRLKHSRAVDRLSRGFSRPRGSSDDDARDSLASTRWPFSFLFSSARRRAASSSLPRPLLSRHFFFTLSCSCFLPRLQPRPVCCLLSPSTLFSLSPGASFTISPVPDFCRFLFLPVNQTGGSYRRSRFVPVRSASVLERVVS